jgi:hypothetical protein
MVIQWQLPRVSSPVVKLIIDACLYETVQLDTIATTANCTSESTQSCIFHSIMLAGELLPLPLLPGL